MRLQQHYRKQTARKGNGSDTSQAIASNCRKNGRNRFVNYAGESAIESHGAILLCTCPLMIQKRYRFIEL
jgi:hypothetical protein